MGKKSFVIDVDKCSGCQLCVIACKDEHVGNAYAPWTRSQPDTGHFWIRVAAMERGRIPRVRMSYLPLLCQHCENAPCIKACADGAIKRRIDGIVWIDPAGCTGCELCEEACPYDVIYMNKELGIAQKCTACAHRVDEGSPPRCVEVCPHDAILFGDEEEVVASKLARGETLEPFHPEYRAEPRALWKGLPKPWIAGVVIDADSDDVISGASVTCVDLFEDGAATVTSDEFGDFWMKGLRPGRKYRVEIAKPGYENHRAVVTTDGDQDLGTVVLTRARASA
jgi:Fe-S-cluster-containing dehydrogenase component